MVTKVRKRDGSVVQYQQDKVAEAIWKAARAVGGQDKTKSDHVAQLVTDDLTKKYGVEGIPGVEEVQDAVERLLIKEGHDQTAKA